MELTDQDVRWAKEAIEKTGLFTNCSPAELQQLIAGLDKQHYHSGQTILFQGEISSRLCLVETGKVSIWVRKGKDRNKVAELGPNSYFGEISLLTPRAATASVKAEDDSTDVIFLPGEVVQAIIKNNPLLSEVINKKIEERLQSQKQAAENK